MLLPINLQEWISENSEKLQPPVNNFCLYDKDNFVVMVVGGPNNRTDYHVNPTEELFYQFKGSMKLKINDDGEFKTIVINQGDLFLLPRNIPHNPVRFENTVGLVVEQKRPLGLNDSLIWYCQECFKMVHSESFYCTDLGIQLKPVINNWLNSKELRRCKNCNHLNK